MKKIMKRKWWPYSAELGAKTYLEEEFACILDADCPVGFRYRVFIEYCVLFLKILKNILGSGPTISVYIGMYAEFPSV